MKRICSYILVLIFIVCNAACGSVGENGGAPAGTASDGARKPAGTVSDGTQKPPDAAAVPAVTLDMGKEDNTRITVAVSIPESRFMDIAAANFQKNNPGIAVEIKYYTTMGETVTQKMSNGSELVVSENTDVGGEKYLKTISTELMSGKGPDIIDTLYIPASRYADNNFLCDLEKMMKQDSGFDMGDYYENIINSTRYKGGLYTMPIDFMASFLSGKCSLPASMTTEELTWEAFFKSAEEALKARGIEGPAVIRCRQEELFMTLFFKSYGKFINEESKKCDFTSGEFTKMIRLVKEAADKKRITGLDKLTESMSDLYRLSLNEYDSNIVKLYKSPGESDELYVYPLPALDGKSGLDINIWYEYGINSNSKSKGAAWKFIKYLVSEEMQSSPELYGFPINKNATAEKSVREKWPHMKTVLSAGDPVFSRANVYPKINWQIYRIAKEETKQYFNGQRSAEETAGILQSRISIVLSE